MPRWTCGTSSPETGTYLLLETTSGGEIHASRLEILLFKATALALLSDFPMALYNRDTLWKANVEADSRTDTKSCQEFTFIQS